MIDHITPAWNIKEFQELEYFQDWPRDIELIDGFVAAGHPRECITAHHRHETNCLPDCCNYIAQHFTSFDNVALSIILLKPGNYLPIHQDSYDSYRRAFDARDRSIFRAIVMLENCYLGQIIQVGDRACGNWRAGDVFSWYDSRPHATYNFSKHNRYAVQVTGVCKKSQPLIDHGPINDSPDIV
jgi:hypothetical protein